MHSVLGLLQKRHCRVVFEHAAYATLNFRLAMHALNGSGWTSDIQTLMTLEGILRFTYRQPPENNKNTVLWRGHTKQQRLSNGI